ncbi:MAG: hypothetical protein CFE32_02875 [Alphaproteobacteria bacterium PA3]|nr:MAG: hypothetical protein CFE32_02875 [Alphaproteobacteria bacterium PA3]
MIAAAALLGSFGAAGSVNGLWATPDARAYSLDGLKIALGLPYGSTGTRHTVQMGGSTALASAGERSREARSHAAAPGESFVAQIFQRPLVHTTPRLVTADAGAMPNRYLPSAAPEPPAPPAPAEPPAAPATPAAAFAGISSVLSSPGAMQSLKALAEADAKRSAKLSSRASEAAITAEQAQASAEVQIGFKEPVAVTQSQYERLEQELDQALQRLEITQTLAARVQDGDFSFVISSEDGKRTCALGQTDGVCGLVSAEDVARIRSEVVTQVKLAQVAVRQSQIKLARARLTNG